MNTHVVLWLIAGLSQIAPAHAQEPVLLGPNVKKAGKPFTGAIGKMGGCTATRVSPPNAPITAVVLAAHCGGGSSASFAVEGETVGGFTCYGNREWNKTQNPSEDVAICFSKTAMKGEEFGCLAPQTKASVGVGDTLEVYGFGAPIVPPASGPHVKELNTVSMKVNSIDPRGAIKATGPDHVTRGDSGGPVVKGTPGAKHFSIVGINSVWFSPTGSGFAPTGNPASLDFYKRALTAAETAMGSAPKVCGINSPAPDDTGPDAPKPDKEKEKENDPNLNGFSGKEIELRLKDLKLTLRAGENSRLKIRSTPEGKLIIEEQRSPTQAIGRAHAEVMAPLQSGASH